MAERLQEAVYRTGMWGKWHSGKTPGYFPWERGFEETCMACHAPLKAPDSIVEKYQDKGLSLNLSTLYAMLDQMDFQIGRLLNALRDLHD